MTLSPGEDGVELQAPFSLKNTRPMPADVIKFDGARMSYLRGITGQEQVASDLTGFTNVVSDNDFAGDSGLLKKSERLLNTWAKRLGLIQAGHQNSEFDGACAICVQIE